MNQRIYDNPRSPTTGRLIDDTLFDEADGALRLVGSRCEECGTVTFPEQRSCPRCTSEGVVRHPLPTVGKLWAFTVQRFPPKTPYLGADAPFEPYAVGYVDLGGEVLVEARLVGSRADDLEVGQPMRLVLEQVPGEPEEPVWIFAFQADGSGEGAST